MKFKGLKVMLCGDDRYIVYPLYHTKKGGTRTLVGLSAMSGVLGDAVKAVIDRLIARQDIGG